MVDDAIRGTRATAFAAGLAALVAVAACGGTPKTDPRYPPREPGCKVLVYKGPVPATTPKHDLGSVDAICGTDIPEADCMRTLMDQVCKFGGDIIWDVPEIPDKPTPDKVRWTARAAHTKAPKAAP
jgi:hypothetical protein